MLKSRVLPLSVFMFALLYFAVYYFPTPWTITYSPYFDLTAFTRLQGMIATAIFVYILSWAFCWVFENNRPFISKRHVLMVGVSVSLLILNDLLASAAKALAGETVAFCVFQALNDFHVIFLLVLMASFSKVLLVVPKSISTRIATMALAITIVQSIYQYISRIAAIPAIMQNDLAPSVAVSFFGGDLYRLSLYAGVMNECRLPLIALNICAYLLLLTLSSPWQRPHTQVLMEQSPGQE